MTEEEDTLLREMVARYPSAWSWDDEDGAEPPYIQVYSDEGTIACLHYEGKLQQNAQAAIARFLCDRANALIFRD